VLSAPLVQRLDQHEGTGKLKAFGIAPPEKTGLAFGISLQRRASAWPACDSTQTERISEFGSTPCKAHYRLLSCAEPFDHFKCI